MSEGPSTGGNGFATPPRRREAVQSQTLTQTSRLGEENRLLVNALGGTGETLQTRAKDASQLETR
jgi:hypothetical protein